MPERARGLRVVVTGAAGGIGDAARRRLAADGARVAGIGLRPAEGCIAGDVSDQASNTAVMEAAAERLGGIDVLVNDAGVGLPQDAGDLPDREAPRVMDVNFFSAWNATAALPHLLRSGRGRVVNVVSGPALVDLPYSAACSASERALEARSNVLRMQYCERPRVVTVYPGCVRTPSHDRFRELGAGLEGLARPETVEAAAAGILAACTGGRGRIALTRPSTFEFWPAIHLPGLVGRAVRGRRRRALASRPRPSLPRETTP